MNRETIIGGLRDPAPGFVCENLRARNEKILYRVPLTHVNLSRTFGEIPDPDLVLASLRDVPKFPGFEQFEAVFRDGNGLGLFLPAARQDPNGSAKNFAMGQEFLGSIVLFPSHEWNSELDTMSEWFPDASEATFDELPYSLEDIVPFAGVNYNPDRWFVVLRGPMAGSICWWTHDGDSVMDAPWAIDLKSWAERVWQELPDVFGGTIRFAASDAIDPCPENAELYPVRYVRNLRDAQA